MVDIANLQIRVDSTEVKRGDKDLQNLNKTSSRTQTQNNTTAKSFSSLGRSIGVMTAAATAFQALRIADEFKLLRARVENSTRTTQEFNFAMRELVSISAQTGSSLESAVEVFQRLSFTRNEINATVEEMTNFTGAVQKLGVVSGASTASLNAGLRQLGQALSSDVTRAEEFNSILENIPAVAVAIANELGVTTGQLRQLVIEGELLSKDVFAAILNQTEDIDSQFQKFPQTIDRALAGLKLRLAESASEFDKLTNGTQIFITGIQIAGRALEGIVGLIKGFGNVLKSFFSVAIGAILSLFTKAAQKLEGLINLAIDGANKLGASFERVKFAPEIDPKIFAEEGLAQAEQELKAAAEGFKQAFEATGIFDLFGLSEGQSQQLETTNTAVREISKNYAEVVKTLGDTDKATKKVKDATRGYRTEVSDLTRVNEELGRSIRDSFADFVTGATDARSALRGIIQEVQRALIVSATGGRSGGGIFGSLAGAVLGSFGGLDFGTFSNIASASSRSFGQVASSALSGAYGPGFASGGSFEIGGNVGTDNNLLQLNGQPLARVSKGEAVNIKRGGQQDSGNVIYNINAQGAENGVEEKIRAVLMEVTALRKQVPNMAVSAVRDTNRRNPKYLSN